MKKIVAIQESHIDFFLKILQKLKIHHQCFIINSLHSDLNQKIHQDLDPYKRFLLSTNLNIIFDLLLTKDKSSTNINQTLLDGTFYLIEHCIRDQKSKISLYRSIKELLFYFPDVTTKAIERYKNFIDYSSEYY
ncbi:hypothetical protein DID76_04110 [Candidatus Marinamargulisbacteria bacterium SCGC AG-414-C22]|nr:hypothetical protein DID76_04110 [Candidatus Marinamargulisbacteria bacterium SCGC AG-414-C22]